MDIQQIPDGVFIKSGVLIWMIKTIVDMVIDRNKSNTSALSKLTTSVSELNKDVNKLTVSIVKLENEIEKINDKSASKNDLNALGQKVRDLEGKKLSHL